MTLRHKNMSKWAKRNLKARAKRAALRRAEVPGQRRPRARRGAAMRSWRTTRRGVRCTSRCVAGMRARAHRSCAPQLQMGDELRKKMETLGSDDEEDRDMQGARSATPRAGPFLISHAPQASSPTRTPRRAATTRPRSARRRCAAPPPPPRLSRCAARGSQARSATGDRAPANRRAEPRGSQVRCAALRTRASARARARAVVTLGVAEACSR
jgi:hypothetical protein